MKTLTGNQIVQSLSKSACKILSADRFTAGDIHDVNVIMHAASYCYRADLRNAAIMINTLFDSESKIDSEVLKQLQTYI